MHATEEKFYSAIILAAVALGFIILFFIYTMIRHQRRNVLLYKSKIRAEINTLEKERKRVAGDLHDELGPLLSAVKMQINRLQSISPKDIEILKSATIHIDNIIQKTRDISYNLLPNTLVRKGIIKAIQEYINKAKSNDELTINLQYNEEFRLNMDREVNVYRIIQEVIHNTQKHAHATKLNINFRIQRDKVVLITADNGSGFKVDEFMKDGDGLGLMNLQSRSEMLNAVFFYESENGIGTTYIFEIPPDEVYING